MALDGPIITLSPVRATDSRETVVLAGHSAQVTDADVVMAPGEPAALVSSSVDGTVRDWDITSGIQTTSSRGQNDDPLALVVATLAHQGRTLGVTITTAKEKNVAIVDLGTGKPIARLNCSSGSVWAATCGWVPEVGHAAITFEDNGLVRIWRLPDGNLVNAFRAYTAQLPIQAGYIPLPGRPLIITCGHGEKAVMWDLVDRRIHNVFGKHTGWTSALACGMTRDGTLVAATGGHDNRVNIWNVIRGRRIGRLKVAERMTYLRHPDSGHAIAISLVMIADHRAIVLVLCADGTLRTFQKKRWRPVYQRAALRANGASSLAVMRLTDGRTVAVTGGQDGRLCAWDLEVALTALSKGDNNVPTLIDIDTEVAITNLSAAGDDTIVTSSLNGLAAFRLHPECL